MSEPDGLFEEPTRVPLTKGDQVEVDTMWGSERATVIDLTRDDDGFPLVTLNTASGDTITVNRARVKAVTS